MTEIERIPLSTLVPLHGGTLDWEDDAVVLVTDPRQGAYSAEAEFDLRGVEGESRMVVVRVRVANGALGAGWLRQDGSDWVMWVDAKAAANAMDLRLIIPAGTLGGKLVLFNGARDGEPSRGVIGSIKIVDHEQDFRAALAEEERGHPDAAIAHYKAVLKIAPSHAGSIAGLGRLRFIPPHQPFLDEVRRRSPVDACEVVIEVRNPCNYRCFYCVAAGRNNIPVQHLNLEKVERAYDGIRGKIIATTLECGGGEPTVHPQFAALLRLCSHHGAVSFPTNNSQNPERWLPKEVASRIYIRSALHPEAEEKLDRYVKHAKYLIDAGCQFDSIFIAHPTRMSKLSEYADFFGERGVPFTPVGFIGEFEGKRYPHSYTEQEKHVLGLHEESRYWAHTIEPHATRIRNFRGIPCIAGYRSVYIKGDGSLRRCMYDDDRRLDAPLDQAEPCGVKNCGCGLLLDKLNTVGGVEFHNSWATLLGAEPIPVDWLEPLAMAFGYEGSHEAMVVEQTEMYDALMAAHGKDEFPE